MALKSYLKRRRIGVVESGGALCLLGARKWQLVIVDKNKLGAGNGTRTRDPLLGKQMVTQVQEWPGSRAVQPHRFANLAAPYGPSPSCATGLKDAWASTACSEP